MHFCRLLAVLACCGQHTLLLHTIVFLLKLIAIRLFTRLNYLNSALFTTMEDPVSPINPENGILPERKVVYCDRCGMPPEYCEYGPDYETECAPKNRPEKPWTVEERLRAFYEKYVPEKVESVPGLLEKYAGREEKLFEALTKKYGPEPEDPFYAQENNTEEAGNSDSKSRRGASAKKESVQKTRVLVTKVSQKRKRHLTIVAGMESVPNLKLKDASKLFSKRFAGSSSVKDNAKGEKEIIIQGDHV